MNTELGGDPGKIVAAGFQKLPRHFELLFPVESDGTPIRCPLVTMFGASNELPEGKELEALFDRFLLRFDVGYLPQAGYPLTGPNQLSRRVRNDGHI